MKKIIYLVLMFGFVSFLQSCDPCADVVCGDFGSCDEGVCICDEGYEQDEAGACNTLINAKFVGSYSLNELCDTGSDTYAVSISAATGLLNLTLNNFYNSSLDIEATIDTDNTSFTIASQAFGTGTISGSGSIDESTGVVTVSYTVVANGQTDACTATLTK